MKLPDTRKSWFDMNMTLEQCMVKCKIECNCSAYATLDLKYGIGCLIWYDQLIDMRILPNNGQDIYIKVAAFEFEKDKRTSRRKNKSIIIVAPVIIALFILLGACSLIIRKKKLKLQERRGLIANKDDLDLPLLRLSTLVAGLAATNNFSISNKLGQGGFGPVYKGYLKDG